MPASSEKQRRFFGAVLALKRKHMKAKDASPELREAAKSISTKDARDFAKQASRTEVVCFGNNGAEDYMDKWMDHIRKLDLKKKGFFHSASRSGYLSEQSS